jgi:hypothetical protein
MTLRFVVKLVRPFFIFLGGGFMADRIEEVRLYAWLGEDEHGSGVIGLKQALVPAGLIPIVATELGKADLAIIQEALNLQARIYGKPISLVEFRVERIIKTLDGSR